MGALMPHPAADRSLRAGYAWGLSVTGTGGGNAISSWRDRRWKYGFGWIYFAGWRVGFESGTRFPKRGRNSRLMAGLAGIARTF